MIKGQHYGTQSVIRSCIVPGMLVRHDGRTWVAGCNRRGKLILSSACCNKLILNDAVEVLLDGHGKPIGDYSLSVFEVVYHDRDYDITDVISNFVKPRVQH